MINILANVSDIGDSFAKLYFESNNMGKIYYIVTLQQFFLPTSEQIKNGLDYEGNDCYIKGTINTMGFETKEINITGLLPGTEYDLLCTSEDPMYNKCRVKRVSFKTLSEEEYSVPPSWSETYPVIDNIYKNKVDAKFKINKDGKGYCEIVLLGEPVPSFNQVRSGLSYNGTAVPKSISELLETNQSHSVMIDGLDESTKYSAFFIMEDSAGNNNGNVSKINFDTCGPNDFAGNTPNIIFVNSNQANLKLISSKTCVAYYSVFQSGVPSPSRTQIRTGKNGAGTSALFHSSINLTEGLETNILISDLFPEKTYDIYIYIE